MNPAAAQEDHGDETHGTVEAVGAPGDGSDLPVDPFGSAVVEPSLHIGEDAVLEAVDDRRLSLPPSGGSPIEAHLGPP